MQKHMVKWGVMLMIAVAAWIGWGTPQALAQRARVPQTGQTTSYAPGDDGAIEAGVEWPTPRFTNRSDGTVRDNLTGLIWLKNANCFGAMTWQNALNAANQLADDRTSTATDCGLSDRSVRGDWRLPNLKELQSLLNLGTVGPALPPGHPFSAVESNFYWSSTTYADNSVNAWGVYLHDGQAFYIAKDSTTLPTFVWPVRGGD